MLYKLERAAPAKRSLCLRQLPAPAASAPWSPPQGFPSDSLPGHLWTLTAQANSYQSSSLGPGGGGNAKGTVGRGPGSGEVWQAGGGPSGSVPSVLLAGLSIFPLMPAPAPNSSELIQSLLRLRGAAQTEDWGRLAPGGVTRPFLTTITYCFRWAEREAKEGEKES